MKQKEQLTVSGHLEIYKVYSDGKQEKVYDDHNLITSGMGVALAALFAGQGDGSVKDFQIRWFQLGVSGEDRRDGNATYDHTIYSLASSMPITYYPSTKVITNTNELGNPNGTDGGDIVCALIPDSSIKRSGTNSVTYILWVPEEMGNTPEPLNEIGLFMHNPLKKLTGAVNTKPRNILVAYRAFNDIEKTNQFSLIFKWKISF